jgi:hypothetical protein
MNQVLTRPSVEALEERLARGAEVLFDMEQRGETDADYARWLARWEELLQEYETLQAA